MKFSNVFITLTLKQIFWEKKTFFEKLEYRFLVATTKIENTSFPFKTALSEANVKTNRMATTKRTYDKELKSSDFYLKLLGMRGNYELCEKILNRDGKIF